MTQMPTQATTHTPGHPPANERTPLYAVAGAADAAVSALREVPVRISGAVNDDQWRAGIRRRFDELPAEARALRDGFPDVVLRAQGRAADLPQRLRERAAQVPRDAAKVYGDLATRGEGVVARLRTEYGPLVDNAVTTVRGRVADVADEVAEITEKATDDIAAKRK